MRQNIAKGPRLGTAELLANKHQRKSVMELLGVLSLKGRKRIAKAPPSKGGKCPIVRKVKKSDKSRRKRERRFREMEICLEVQLGIEEGRIPMSAIGEVSFPDVLTASEGEQEESKTL